MDDKTIITDDHKQSTLIVEPPSDDITAKTGLLNHTEVGSYDIVLKGKSYHNIKCLSSSSGEAEIYLVVYGENEYVLKLYYPNCKLNRQVSKVIYNINFEMITNVIDFGYTFVDGNKRDYELMEYLHGGTLADYKLNHNIKNFRSIALQCAAALHYCHLRRIIHKDIKPSNFFFRDDQHTQVVLGDFGISLFFTLESEGVIRTTQARTPTYAAPEMYTNVIDGEVEITPAVDFYSLGMTLFALWLGNEIHSADERKMMQQKNEGHLPRINELPERVKMLIQGLTTVNSSTRWGYDEVERWFKGEQVDVDISSPFLKYKNFIVDPERNLMASNPKELAQLLFENRRLAITYLYNHKISQWLESCGNEKIALKVENIVNDLYHVDTKAGLIACIYSIDESFPYIDVNGNNCTDIHQISMALLNNVDKYSLLLSDFKDPLFLYLESHTDCDIDRLRALFGKKGIDRHVAIMSLVYEIDSDIPFLSKYPSSTLKDITYAFGHFDCTEDDWRSLCDGRLLSWMYCHSDRMATESIRILTENRQYTHSFAYKILYNIDRDAAFDLRDARSPEEVGELMNIKLQECQNLSKKEFASELFDYVDPDGRLAYYAQMHGWYDYVSEGIKCFNLESEENHNRMGAYDIQTASYRFCRILGVIPKYKLDELNVLSDGHNVSKNYMNSVRHEIRSGNFSQWLAIFYHEDPFADFSEAYSYERTLEEWILLLGEFDINQKYYRRYVTARKETDEQTESARQLWAHASNKEIIWSYTFYCLCILWLIFVIFVGITPDGRRYLMNHTVFSIGVPLGLCSALICAVHSYFNGYGFTIGTGISLLGFATAAIPIMILREVYKGIPSLFILTIVIITIIYAYICYVTNFRHNSDEDKQAINQVLDDDIKSTLLEPLYFTFRTNSYKYKGSKFAMLQDVSDHIRSMAGESVIHYMCWSLMIAVFVIDFIIYSPHLGNTVNPKLPTWRVDYQEVLQKLKHDVE
ncbi:MAG: protein kinase [Prevotella sp.]|nr:protein kinase [Prevotella sp.]